MGWPKFAEDVEKLRNEYFSYSEQILSDISKIDSTEKLALLRSQITDRLNGLKKFVDDIYELATLPEFNALQELRDTKKRISSLENDLKIKNITKSSEVSRLEHKIHDLNEKIKKKPNSIKKNLRN